MEEKGESEGISFCPEVGMWKSEEGGKSRVYIMGVSQGGTNSQPNSLPPDSCPQSLCFKAITYHLEDSDSNDHSDVLNICMNPHSGCHIESSLQFYDVGAIFI